MALKFEITGDNRNFLQSMEGVQRGIRQTAQTVEQTGRSVDSMFSQIRDSALTSFKDIAKGIVGITALMKSGEFVKSAYSELGKFSVAMKEVSTLSEDVANNLSTYRDKVLDMSTDIAIDPEEAAKALYQIESAGHHAADGLNVLEVSAKAAIGGVTETETAADAITTILNAYNMSASEAEHVSDLLFTTVRLVRQI